MSTDFTGHHRGQGSGISRIPLAPGLRIAGSEYLLKRMLGRGGLGEVWLAFSRKHEADVALKFFPHQLLQDAHALDRLRAETVRCHHLEHASIVRTFEFVQDDDSVAVAMEYVEGWSLAALKVDRENKRYRAAEIETHIRQLCAVLDYAHHDFAIVHRDLKPANLLTDAREHLKVTDFALAQVARSALTQQGHLVYGALGFMSPQQLRGSEPSVLDDVYSLGATIYDLLTGAPPFYKGEILAQMLEQTPPRMSERLLEIGVEDVKGIIPPAWDATVVACLAKNPADRPQSAGDVAKLLSRSDEEALAWLLQPGILEKSSPKSFASAAPGPTHDLPNKTVTLPPQTIPTINPEPAVEPPKITGTVSVSEPIAEMTFAEPAADVQVLTSPAESVEVAPAPSPVSWKSRLQPITDRVRSLPRPALIVIAVALMLLITLPFMLSRAKLKPALPAGSLDPSFHPGAGAGNDIRALALQSDGRILVGGRFSTFDGAAIHGLARLAVTGQLDTNFNPEINGAVHDIATQPDGRILIAGDFQRINGSIRRRIARLNADGSLDTDFNAHAALNREARALVVQPDKKILVGGSFDSAGGRAHAGVTRLTATGNRDAAFHPGTGANNLVWSVALQKDGRIIIVGDFTRYNGVAAGRVARLNEDGSLDESFAVGSGADATVNTAVLLPDQSILLGGNFTTFSEQDHKRILRLKPNGSIDPAFKSPFGEDGGIRSIATDRRGRFVVGGTFFTAGGAARNYLARLNANGEIDASFNSGEGPGGGGIWRVQIQSDEKILVAGSFANFNALPAGRIVRLNPGE